MSLSDGGLDGMKDRPEPWEELLAQIESEHQDDPTSKREERALMRIDLDRITSLVSPESTPTMPSTPRKLIRHSGGLFPTASRQDLADQDRLSYLYTKFLMTKLTIDGQRYLTYLARETAVSASHRMESDAKRYEQGSITRELADEYTVMTNVMNKNVTMDAINAMTRSMIASIEEGE